MFGKLYLTAQINNEEKSVLSNVNFASPVKVMKPFYLDAIGTAYLYISDISGGMLSNDKTEYHVTVKENAHLYLTNIASTKIHPMNVGCAMIDQYFFIEPNGSLEYFPEEMTLFENSSLKSSTVIDLHPTSVLAFSEIIFMGRKNYGELLRFNQLNSSFKMTMNKRLLLIDQMNIQPNKVDYKGFGYMESKSHYGTLYVYSNKNNTALLEKVRSIIQTCAVQMQAGCSMHPGGVLVIKALAHNQYSIKKMFTNIWLELRPILLKEAMPYIRK